MNDRDIAEQGTILRILAGSQIHGTNLPGNSDRDEMGIAVAPKTHVLGLRTFEQWVYRDAADGDRSGDGDLDLTVYDLRKWTRLAAAGNPSMLLPLFAPSDGVITETVEGTRLREHAGLFVSKQAGHRFLGYLRSQRDKILGERGNRTKRPELVDTYGFDTKFAYHAVRLGAQGVEFLTDGRFTLPMREPLRSWLIDLRMGHHTQAEALDAIAGSEAALEQLISDANTSIPRKTDMNVLSRLLVDLHESWWSREPPEDPRAPA